MARVLVGTGDGIHVLQRSGSVELAGRSVTALGRDDRELWAILGRTEIWHSDGGSGWSHAATVEGVRGNCVAATAAGVLVGTSEAQLLRLAGEQLEPAGAFAATEGRGDWYTPWGGPPDVRSISEDDDAVYVNVHVGGIPRSSDRGASWEPTIDIHADVHRVWANHGHVLAACARGLAVSDDQGDSWTIRSDGLHSTYCRGVAVCGDTVLVSASDGPRGGRGAVYRGQLDGGSLERCRLGLPEWFDDNIDSYCLDATEDLVAFGTGDGRVFASSDQGTTWAEMAAGLPSVVCLLLMP